jgi:H+-transporting ATPase
LDKTLKNIINIQRMDRDHIGTGDHNGTGERYSVEDIMLTSYFSSELGTQDPIESAIRKEAEEKVYILSDRSSKSHKIPGYNIDSFTPFNPTTKYTEAKVTDTATGKQFRCIKGAPHIIVELSSSNSD